MTAPNNPTPERSERAKTAEGVARATGPCWGDGIVAPRQCDEVYMCELHGGFAQALESYADSVAEEQLDRQSVLLNKVGMDEAEQYGYSKGFRAGQKRMRERAMKTVHRHAMPTPQCSCHEERYSCDSYKETDIRSLEVGEK